MDEKIKKAKEKLHKVYKEGEKYKMKLLKELESELEKEKISERKESDEIKKAEDRLKKIYEDAEKTELMLMKQLKEELLKEKNDHTTLTLEQQKEAVQMGVMLADKMDLDMLKLKYQQNLKENGGIRNKKIEELIENLKKNNFYDKS